jgi:hypothetical protein
MKSGGEMNKKQKIILIVVAVVIVAMLLFPPVRFQYEGTVRGAGYRFILDSGPLTVNTTLLLTQWVGVLIIGAIAFFVAKEGK